MGIRPIVWDKKWFFFRTPTRLGVGDDDEKKTRREEVVERNDRKHVSSAAQVTSRDIRVYSAMERQVNGMCTTTVVTVVSA